MPPDQPPQGGAKVPLVSEVVDRLVKEMGAAAPRRPALFQAALQVCSEELRKVKKGAASAPIEELVMRARQILSPSTENRAEVAAFAGELSPLLDKALGASEAAPPGLGAPPLPAGGDQAPLPFPADDAQPSELPAPPSDAADPFRFEPAPPKPAKPPARPQVKPAPMPKPRPQPEFGTLFAETTEEEVREPSARRKPRRFSVLGLSMLFAVVILGSVAGFFLLGPLLSRPSDDSLSGNATTPGTTIPSNLAQPVVTPSSEPGQGPASAAPTSAAVVRVEPTQAPIVLPTPTEAPRPIQRPTAPVRSARQSEDSSIMASPDWVGRASVYAIHFSSFRERDKADRDAARLASMLSLPAHAAAVDLGKSGTWYRVMVGEFATYEQAMSTKLRLEPQFGREMSSIYRLVGSR